MFLDWSQAREATGLPRIGKNTEAVAKEDIPLSSPVKRPSFTALDRQLREIDCKDYDLSVI